MDCAIAVAIILFTSTTFLTMQFHYEKKVYQFELNGQYFESHFSTNINSGVGNRTIENLVNNVTEKMLNFSFGQCILIHAPSLVSFTPKGLCKY